MKKTILLHAMLLAFTPLLVQCVASEQEVRGLDLRARTLDTRVSELEQLNAAIRNQAANQARMGSDLDGFESKILQIEGRIDEIEHRRAVTEEQIRENSQATNMRLDNIDISLKELNAGQKELEERIQLALAQLGAKQEENHRQLVELKEQRAKEAAQRAAEAEAAARAAERARREAEARQREEAARLKSAASDGQPHEIVPQQSKQKPGQGGEAGAEESDEPTLSQSPPPAPKDLTPSEQVETETVSSAATPITPGGPGAEHYQEGVELLQQKSYQQAYNAFSRYLETAPEGEMAADARYLLGESLFMQEEYELAILEYQKVIANFGKKPKVAAAMLRQGMAFEKLREPNTAEIVYQRLVEEFPDSEQARKAKKLMER